MIDPEVGGPECHNCGMQLDPDYDGICKNCGEIDPALAEAGLAEEAAEVDMGADR